MPVGAASGRRIWPALPAAEPLIAALRDPHVQAAVGALGGYDISRPGTVQLLS